MIDGNEAFYFIADYHANHCARCVGTPARYVRDRRGLPRLWSDPERAVVWRQSDVPEVCELTYL